MKCDSLEPCPICNCGNTIALDTLLLKVSPSTALNAKNEAKRLTPIKAIRAKCLDCCSGSFSEVKHCTVTGCALWLYHLGRRPVKGGEPCGT